MGVYVIWSSLVPEACCRLQFMNSQVSGLSALVSYGFHRDNMFEIRLHNSVWIWHVLADKLYISKLTASTLDCLGGLSWARYQMVPNERLATWRRAIESTGTNNKKVFSIKLKRATWSLNSHARIILSFIRPANVSRHLCWERANFDSNDWRVASCWSHSRPWAEQIIMSIRKVEFASLEIDHSQRS